MCSIGVHKDSRFWVALSPACLLPGAVSIGYPWIGLLASELEFCFDRTSLHWGGLRPPFLVSGKNSYIKVELNHETDSFGYGLRFLFEISIYLDSLTPIKGIRGRFFAKGLS